MKRSIAVLVLAFMVFWSLHVPASAGSLSGTFEGDSTLTPTGSPGIYTQSFTGDGDDVTYGLFTPSATSTIDFSHPPNIVISDTTILLTFSDRDPVRNRFWKRHRQRQWNGHIYRRLRDHRGNRDLRRRTG